MTINFHKLLLSELHMVVFQPGDPAGLTDGLLCEAVTLNENLRSLGYTLKPEDLVKLAASPSLDDFWNHVCTLVPEVKAEPMYPGFPGQVMEISEAEFRLHQMLHYFSTYGLEGLFGVSVSRGWLPDYAGPVRDRQDTLLLEERVIDLVSGQQAPITALTTLLARRERLDNPKLELVLEAAQSSDPEQLQHLTVRFKENLELLFPMLLEKADSKTALGTLRAVCPHTGDVLRCAAAYLSARGYHLRTREKKLLVRLLEQYPVENFRRNLIQSRNLRERNLLVLRHLDYNRFSRSPEHRETVRALRNGELLSWQGVGEAMLREKDPGALDYLAQRPGVMLRMLNRLLSLDYAREDILAALAPKAGAISAQLILKAIRSLNGRENDLEQKHAQQITACRRKYFQETHRLNPQNLAHDYRWSTMLCRRQAEERRIAAEYTRDHPTIGPRKKARDMVQPARLALATKEAQYAPVKLALEKQEAFLRSGGSHYRLIRNAVSAFDEEVLRYLYAPEHYRNAAAALEAEIRELEEQLRLAQAEADAWYARETRDFTAHIARCEETIARIHREEAAELANLERQYRQDLEESRRKFSNLPALEEAELAALKARHESELRMCRYDAAAVAILKELLKEHFRQAHTPLKGKRVFLDLEQFDLTRSVLESSDASADGGYIRSGICFRIPEEAKIVRFFVYWNDPSRVDIDLHAGGISTDRKDLHIGWNGEFRDCGVIHSGDITHSNAAEYIDIDLSAPVQEIYANIHLYGGKRGFREVETCYVGMMAVDKMGQEVALYSPANCFFHHELTQNLRSMFYGYVDVQNRFVRFVGKANEGSWSGRPQLEAPEQLFSAQDYLDCVLDAQQARIVEREEEADVVLTMGKNLLCNGVSLVDQNFFLEC